ncbi:MAG: hypothetical protein WCO96_04940 [Actinomycetes bacterium]
MPSGKRRFGSHLALLSAISATAALAFGAAAQEAQAQSYEPIKCQNSGSQVVAGVTVTLVKSAEPDGQHLPCGTGGLSDAWYEHGRLKGKPDTWWETSTHWTFSRGISGIAFDIEDNRPADGGLARYKIIGKNANGDVVYPSQNLVFENRNSNWRRVEVFDEDIVSLEVEQRLTSRVHVSAISMYLIGGKLSVGFGNHAGQLTSDIGGIDCDANGGECQTTVALSHTPQPITLTATPPAGLEFSSWSGCDSSTKPPSAPPFTCTVLMSSARAVTAYFIDPTEPVPPVGTTTSYLDVEVMGKGSVKSSPSGINCSNTLTECSTQFQNQPKVTLTATPAKGWRFVRWSGDRCVNSTSRVCVIPKGQIECEQVYAEFAKAEVRVARAAVKRTLPTGIQLVPVSFVSTDSGRATVAVVKCSADKCNGKPLFKLNTITAKGANSLRLKVRRLRPGRYQFAVSNSVSGSKASFTVAAPAPKFTG